MQFIIYIFIKKVFCANLHRKSCSEASHFKVRSSLSFSSLDPKITNNTTEKVIITNEELQPIYIHN